MIEAHELVAGGGILYDPSRVSKPTGALFDRDAWSAHSGVTTGLGGRGGVLFIRDGERRWVWRHYRRGGVIAKFIADRYLWMGANATRAFREWRLLAELKQLDLPVPTPVAARYRRHGCFYEADLMTEELPDARTLAQFITAEDLNSTAWREIGETLARFHRNGVRHADLNAHNILFAGGRIYLIDFDRGRRCARGAWEQTVIARLLRSLSKIKANQPRVHFEAADWQALLAGYEASIQ